MVAIRLAHDKQLTADETSGLRAAADDLLLILRFIENNRLDGTEGRLQKNQLERLDNAIGLLAQIQARLHHQFFPAAEGLSVSQ